MNPHFPPYATVMKCVDPLALCSVCLHTQQQGGVHMACEQAIFTMMWSANNKMHFAFCCAGHLIDEDEL